MYGATMGTITLESYNGATWSQLWAMKGNKGDVWRQASVSLPVGALKLRFTGQTTTSYTSDFALDDLVLKQGVSPTTQAPTTVPPVTQAPTTMPPVTQAPTTMPPVTQAPTTMPPVTQAPTLPPTTATTTSIGDVLIPIVVNASETDHFDIKVSITK